MRLLIAEDNEADVFLIRECLNSAGLEYEALVASTGEKAMAIIDRGGELEGMILDLNLPTHNGFEILRHAREVESLKGISIVILSSSDAPQDRMRAEHLGASAFFRKPLDLSEFMMIGRDIARIFRRD